MQDKKIRREYGEDKGKKIQGVTTIKGSNLNWGGEGLNYWAWKLGTEGKDFRKERNYKAKLGTITHSMTWRLLGFDDGERWEQWEEDMCAENAKRSAEYIQRNFEIVANEIAYTVAGYGPNALSFGGTIDLIVKNKEGEYGVVDLKTSKTPHEDMVIQLGAYKTLWDYHNPNHPITWAGIVHAPFEGEFCPPFPPDFLGVDLEALKAGQKVFDHILEIDALKDVCTFTE